MHDCKSRRRLLCSLAVLASAVTLTACAGHSSASRSSASSSCPSPVGTYQPPENPKAVFYVQEAKNSGSGYRFIYAAGNGYMEKPAHFLSREEQKSLSITVPDCSLGVPELGVLSRVKKGAPYSTVVRSPDGVSDETFSSDYAFFLFYGDIARIMDADKISDSGTLPAGKKIMAQPETRQSSNQKKYAKELASAMKAAQKNNPAAQFFLARSSAAVRNGMDDDYWYARSSDPGTRAFWLNKALANGYGPAYCYQAATIRDKEPVFTEREKITLYQQALAKGNAPLAGVYLADLTSDPAQKMQYLITAVHQGSFVALWRLGALAPDKQAALPADIKELIKNPPFDRLKKVSPDTMKRYEDGKGHKEWRDDPYKFDMEFFITSQQLYGKTGIDLDYNQRPRPDCLEADLLILSDYPQ